MWLPVGVGTAVTVLAVPAFVWSSSAGGAPGIAWTSVASVTLYTVAIGAAWIRSSGSTATGYLSSAGRVAAASVPAGLVVRLVADRLGAGTAGSVAALVVGAAAGVAVFWTVGRLTGLTELDRVAARIGARLRRTG